MADILVVDDEESIAGAFRRFLTDEGHEVRIASTAAEGLRLIAEHPPNIAFMDIRMPGLDGTEALQAIRAQFPGVYVVMMTAYGTSQTSIDAIRLGESAQQKWVISNTPGTVFEDLIVMPLRVSEGSDGAPGSG